MATDKEEDHHQAIIDEPLETALEDERADANAERRVQEVNVAPGPWRVRPNERDGGGDEQQDAAGGLDVKKRSSGRPARAPSSTGKPWRLSFRVGPDPA
jgi:hypothetical protein